MRTYLDTSALVKLYYPEEESESVAQWVIRNNEPIPFTSLHELELKNALALKIFRREIKKDRLNVIRRLLEKDLRDGVLVRPVINWGDLFSWASKLSASYTPKIGCRSMDILHVACALQTACPRFLTFDERQEKLAKRAGLRHVRKLLSRK